MDPDQHNATQEKPADEKAVSPEPQPSRQGQNPHRHGQRRPRFKRDNRGGRGDRGPRPEQSRPPEAEQRKSSGSIRKAIEQVELIRCELKKALDDMHEVLRTLEQVEREKTASEEEIELLRESLRLLHRDQGQARQPRNSPPRPTSPMPDPSSPEAEAEQDSDQTL